MMKREGNGIMGRFKVDIELANLTDMHLAQAGALDPAKVRRLRIQGVVDTGATRLVLPAKVVSQLGFPSAGKAIVRYADKPKASRDKVKEVWLQLMGRDGTYTAIVEPKRKDALIGAIVLEDLDFVVDCTTQTLHPRNLKWIVSEIE